MAKSAADMATNWQQAMAAPSTATKYKQGIAATTVNPMQAAASPAAMQLYLQKVQDSVTSGKRAAALNAVPMSAWQQNAQNVGAARLTSGATKAQNKVTAHFNKWAPIYAQASQAAAAIPKDGTHATAVAKVAAAIQVMMQAAGTA